MTASLTINGKTFDFQGIRPLKQGIDVKTAADKTKANGLDEVFFSKGDGKVYVAYSDRLNLSGLRQQQQPQVALEGKPVRFITHQDEINTLSQGFWRGGTQGVEKVADTATETARTSIVVLGTAGSAAMVALGTAAGGYAIYKGAGAVGVAESSKGAVKAFLQSMLGGGIGAIKLVAGAAVVGAGLSFVAGGIKGASEVGNKDRDYASIAEIAEPE